MGLLDIGYHLIFEQSGAAILCRALGVMGSHCPGYNHNSIGLCLIGDHEFSPEQIVSCASWLASLHALHPSAEIKGHDELPRYRRRQQPCPSIDMNMMRRRVREYEPPVPDRP